MHVKLGIERFCEVERFFFASRAFPLQNGRTTNYQIDRHSNEQKSPSSRNLLYKGFSRYSSHERQNNNTKKDCCKRTVAKPTRSMSPSAEAGLGFFERTCRNDYTTLKTCMTYLDIRATDGGAAKNGGPFEL